MRACVLTASSRIQPLPNIRLHLIPAPSKPQQLPQRRKTIPQLIKITLRRDVMNLVAEHLEYVFLGELVGQDTSVYALVWGLERRTSKSLRDIVTGAMAINSRAYIGHSGFKKSR